MAFRTSGSPDHQRKLRREVQRRNCGRLQLSGKAGHGRLGGNLSLQHHREWNSLGLHQQHLRGPRQQREIAWMDPHEVAIKRGSRLARPRFLQASCITVRTKTFLRNGSLMKISLRSTSCLVGLLLASLSSYAQNDGSAAKGGPIVVLMTIDGFPARALKDPRLPMPTLRRMIAEGAHADAMIPVNPTVTWPNHTALITGVDASAHHVLANG